MKRFIAPLVLMAIAASAGPAAADGDVQCDSQRADRKPMLHLQRELKAKGWTVRKIQAWQGCYEVYGYDDKDKPVEAYFHPVTFVRVRETIAGIRDPASFDPKASPAAGPTPTKN